MKVCTMKNSLRAALLCLLPYSLCLSAELRYINGKVTKVPDGDTITVKDADGRDWRIRFYGVDTPEHKVPDRWDEHL